MHLHGGVSCLDGDVGTLTWESHDSWTILSAHFKTMETSYFLSAELFIGRCFLKPSFSSKVLIQNCDFGDGWETG